MKCEKKIYKLVAVLVAGSFLVSCAYLQKLKGSDEGPEITGPGSEDVLNTDIDSDRTGSDSRNIEGLRTVFFELDSSTLSADTKNILEQNIQWLNSNPKVNRLELEGHCDPLGSNAYNIGLGQRRAEAVKHYLIEVLRINEQKLSVISYGEEKLISETENHLNRRVNFVPIY